MFPVYEPSNLSYVVGFPNLSCEDYQLLPVVSGDYMEDLIHAWMYHRVIEAWKKIIFSTLDLAPGIVDQKFEQCLAVHASEYYKIARQLQTDRLLWEELPAWDEVCKLKNPFVNARNTSTRVKRLFLIMVQVLPEPRAVAHGVDLPSGHYCYIKRQVLRTKERLEQREKTLEKIPSLSSIMHNDPEFPIYGYFGRCHTSPDSNDRELGLLISHDIIESEFKIKTDKLGIQLNFYPSDILD